MAKKGSNKLLEIISEETLRDLLYTKLMTPWAIDKQYGLAHGVTKRALKICHIILDPTVWKVGTSTKQRQLALLGVKLTDEQQQILIGSLLGDGYISKHGNEMPRFEFTQSIIHKEYLEYIIDILEPFSYPLYMFDGHLKAMNKSYPTGMFYTVNYDEFTRFREWFYPVGKKVVPINIEEMLTPLALAHWFMQDGNNGNNGRSITLHTNGFTGSDVERLISILYKKFGVASHLRWYKGKEELQPTIFIGATAGYDLFHSLVDAFIEPFTCFKHKLGRDRKPVAKLTEYEVREIRQLYDSGDYSQGKLALKYNVHQTTIGYVVLQKSWKHISEVVPIEGGDTNV